jgi:hypothetical protein
MVRAMRGMQAEVIGKRRTKRDVTLKKSIFFGSKNIQVNQFNWTYSKIAME